MVVGLWSAALCRQHLIFRVSNWLRRIGRPVDFSPGRVLTDLIIVWPVERSPKGATEQAIAPTAPMRNNYHPIPLN
jgi:hypothetical protein